MTVLHCLPDARIIEAMTQVLRAVVMCISVASVVALSFDMLEAKTRPVTKVVQLLKGMQDQMQKESDADAETYKTYKCWCTTNGEEKLKALAEAEQRIKAMEAKVEELTATSASLGVEIPNLGKDIVKLNEGMDKAVAIRQKAVEKFTARESELVKNVNSVGSALSTIGSGTNTSFIQLSNGVSANLQHILADRMMDLDNTDYATMAAFLQEESPGSDQVVGILKGIKSDLDHELKQLQEQDSKAQASYEAVIKAKRAEIDAAKATLESKKEQKANADEQKTRTTQDIKDTKESMGADAAFAMEVKQKCAVFEKEFDERKKTRADETEAISKALEILTSDENFDHFSKTLSFIQLSNKNTLRREKVSSTLMSAGKRLDDRLVTIALQAKLDNFERVKESIDDMVTALKKEMDDEVKHKDFCVQQFQQNKLATEEKTRATKTIAAEAGDLQIKMNQSATVITTLQGEIAELRKQLNIAAKNRESENTNFQDVVTEQRETQKALKQALAVLNEFYAAKQKPAFAQVDEEQEPGKAEPKGFKAYEKNAAGTGVISMLNQLITDARALEVESTAAERTAQEAYETFSKDTTASIEKKQKAIVDESDTKARYESALQQATQSRQGAEQELAKLATVEADLHGSCDFVLKNFDLRQQARSEEIDALKQAKSFLSGAKFLQRS